MLFFIQHSLFYCAFYFCKALFSDQILLVSDWSGSCELSSTDVSKQKRMVKQSIIMVLVVYLFVCLNTSFIK